MLTWWSLWANPDVNLNTIVENKHVLATFELFFLEKQYYNKFILPIEFRFWCLARRNFADDQLALLLMNHIQITAQTANANKFDLTVESETRNNFFGPFCFDIIVKSYRKYAFLPGSGAFLAAGNDAGLPLRMYSCLDFIHKQCFWRLPERSPRDFGIVAFNANRHRCLA